VNDARVVRNSPRMCARIAMVLVVLMVGGQTARATCSFDSDSGVLTVTQGGGDLSIGAGGEIELDAQPCGTATTTNTMRIVVNGSPTLRDELSLRGTFAPGLDDGAETGLAEIEIELIGFTGTTDELLVNGTGAPNTWRFSASDIDLNGDGDADVTAPSGGKITLKALGGNDLVDASAYTGAARLRLHGGNGNDSITGGPGGDIISGNAGDDTLFGGAGNDTIYHGLGADKVRAGSGSDSISTDVNGLPTGAGDAGDDLRGNAGSDTVRYSSRSVGIVVTLDDLADDGEPGENDNVHFDVENVVAGAGDDVLVGSSVRNVLVGGTGANELYGGDGDDDLDAGLDQAVGSIVLGEGGDDNLAGSDGNDVLDGGDGDDILDAFLGNDTLDGGAGVDWFFGGLGNDVILNADGIAETVDCGPGTDNPEPDALDTFVACENI